MKTGSSFHYYRPGTLSGFAQVGFLGFTKLLLTLLLLTLFPLSSAADTVILKNGMKFNSERIWEENGEIKCYVNGLVVGFPKEDVQRITNAPPEAVEMSASVNAESIKYDLITSKKHLDRKKKELDLEYQALMQEVKQLENEKKQPASGIETSKLNERILRHNQKVKEYESKKKAFDMEVIAFQREVEKESSRQLIDEEKFSEMLRSWVSSPVDDFINKWGYPDQIINMPDGSRRYLFKFEITPVLTRQITFGTNQSGVIVEFTVERGNSNDK